VNPYGNMEYTVNRLTHRTKQADFKMLAPEIQENFNLYIVALEDAIMEKERAIQRLKSERIPTDGFLVTVQLKRTDPETGKQDNIRLPYSTVQWVVDALEQQGSTLEALDAMNQGALAQASDMLASQLQGQEVPTLPTKK
jgi:anion-transporting  ArsA/GET3 family ATPase